MTAHSVHLGVTICWTPSERHIAVIDGLPQTDAPMTPSQCRALARVLIRIADETEGMDPDTWRAVRREYSLVDEPKPRARGLILSD